MHTHDIVVVGTSAGGVEALTVLVAGLPSDLPAAVFVVLHMPETAESHLAQILNRFGDLTATTPYDGEAIEPGHIWVAPPNRHLLLTHDAIRLSTGPHENRCRPAIDPLFRTAALAFGPRVVGVVLSGTLDDGTAGELAIKRQGGVVIVQDPQTALFPSMPLNVRTYVDVDWCLPVPEIATKIVELANLPVVEGVFPMSEELQYEANAAGLDPSVLESTKRPGKLSAFTCPECKGPLWEIQDGRLLRFRCRVGHAFTAENMAEGQAEAIEGALWSAMNILKEQAQMFTRLARQAHDQHRAHMANHFAQKAQAAAERARIIRDTLLPEKDTRIRSAERPAQAEGA